MEGKRDTGLSLNEIVESTCASIGDADCARSKEYLTKEEAFILAEIKKLREAFLAAKNRLKRLEVCLGNETEACETGVTTPNYQVLTDQLADLRRKRQALERLREEAHRRKMVMLGHEDG